MREYVFRIYKNVYSSMIPGTPPTHVMVAAYPHLPAVPWVPPVGSYFRFRDPSPPEGEKSHREVAGRVSNVVTVLYGISTTIEIYLDDVRIQ